MNLVNCQSKRRTSSIHELPEEIEAEFTKVEVRPSGDAVILHDMIESKYGSRVAKRQNAEMITSVHEGGHALFHAFKLKEHLAKGGSVDAYLHDEERSEKAATALEKIYANTGGLSTEQIEGWKKKYIESDEKK